MPKLKKPAKFGAFCHSSATEETDGDEIWHTSVDDGYTLAYKFGYYKKNYKRFTAPWTVSGTTRVSWY